MRTETHASMNIPDVKTWLDLPAGYWNLNYDDPLRLEIREKVAFQTMMENTESIDALELSDLIPQVYEYSDGEVSVHTMSDNDCAEFVAPESSLNRDIQHFHAGADRFSAGVRRGPHRRQPSARLRLI